MMEQDDQADSGTLIRRIFYLLTARCEDGATVAADGQAPGMDPAARTELANRLRSLAAEVETLADVAAALGRDQEALTRRV